MPATDARKELVAQAFRFELAEDAAIDTAHLRARELDLNSFLDDTTQAANLAQDRLDFFGVKRDNYRLTVEGQQFTRRIGETISVTFAKFGLNDALAFIKGVEEQLDGRTTVLQVII